MLPLTHILQISPATVNEPQLGANNISARLSGSTEMLVAGPSGKIFDTEDHQIPSSMNIKAHHQISIDDGHISSNIYIYQNDIKVI